MSRFVVFVAIIADVRASDPCTILQATDDASYELMDSGTIPSYCYYNDFCWSLRKRDAPHEPISCETAFQVLTNRNSEQIQELPIVLLIDEETHDLFAENEQCYTEAKDSSLDAMYYGGTDLSMRGLLDELASTTEQIVARIFDGFPRMIYVEAIDGPLLRNLIDIADKLSPDEEPDEDSDSINDVSKYVMRTESMRKFARAIAMMTEHVTIQPLRQTEKYIVAMAPWLHAFMKATFHLKILYPYFWNDYGWLLLRASTIHPLYDRESPIWYMLLDSRMPHEIFTHRHDMITWEIVVDVFEDPSQVERDGEFLLRQLVANMTGYLQTQNSTETFEEHYQYSVAIRNLVYAMDYLSAFDAFDFMAITSPADLQTMEEVFGSNLGAGIGATAVRCLLRLFMRGLSPATWKRYPPLLSKTATENVPLRANYQAREIIVEYSGLRISRKHLFSTLLNFTKHDFMMGFEWAHMGIETKIFPDMLGDMLDAFLSPFVGWFVMDSNGDDLLDILNDESVFYRINPDFARSHPAIQVALGRLIGLILWVRNPQQILNKYIKPPRPDSTVFETLFFGSRFIQKGFNDVYIADAFTASFRNGQELCTKIAQTSY
jgi:hypothetical protein